MDNTAAVTHGADSSRARRPVLFAKVSTGLAALALLAHFLPIGNALQSQVGAVAVVVISGLGFLTWIPKQRLDLSCSVVLAGGLALTVLASSALLILDWYTPDRAAVLAVLVALTSLFFSAKMAGTR